MTTVVKYAPRLFPGSRGGRRGAGRWSGRYARKADEWLEADRRMPRVSGLCVHERLWRNAASKVIRWQRWVKRWRQRQWDEAEDSNELNGRRAARA